MKHHQHGGRLANLDMYRKVPIDLLEGSKEGSIVSWIALLVIATLFFLETKAFFTNDIQTDLALDTTTDKLLRVNFNVTMMDLPCDYATVNVMSVFSGKQYAQTNITQHITKYSVDENQVTQQYMDRNFQQNDIVLADEKVKETLEEMIDKKQREDAVLLTPDEFQDAITEHMFVFVDMFASWCSHCQVREKKASCAFCSFAVSYVFTLPTFAIVGTGTHVGKTGRSDS